jgi:hypothetical protein
MWTCRKKEEGEEGMFKKSIEAIIADGKRDLEFLSEQAASKALEAKSAVIRCTQEIEAMVQLAKDVPEKVFDRYSHVLVAVGDIYSTGNFGRPTYVDIGGTHLQLRGLMGQEQVKTGKYRVIVMLEPIS